MVLRFVLPLLLLRCPPAARAFAGAFASFGRAEEHPSGSLLLAARTALPLPRLICLGRAASSSSEERGGDEPSPRPRVLCVGDALFDCIADDDARGLSVSEMTASGMWTAFHGGANANVACSLVKLGSPSAFAGCVGSDSDGDEIEDLLRNTGVDVTLLRRSGEGGAPTRRVMVTRSLDGDRAFGGFDGGRSADEFADCFLDASTLTGDEAESLIHGADWIVSGTLSLAYQQSARAVRSLVDRGLSAGARLFVDVNWRPVFWPQGEEVRAREEILTFSRRASAVKLTDEEAEWLLGVPAEEALDDPVRVHKEFPGAAVVLVTAGEKGAAYSALGWVGFVEPFGVDVVETTGAGDAFTAGFLHGLLSMGVDIDSFEESVPSEEQQEVVDKLIRFAAACGAITCTNEGAIAAQPTFDQVESFLIHGEKVWE